MVEAAERRWGEERKGAGFEGVQVEGERGMRLRERKRKGSSVDDAVSSESVKCRRGLRGSVEFGRESEGGRCRSGEELEVEAENSRQSFHGANENFRCWEL